eukprot:410474-Rhodomonas_salina.1
MALATPRGPPVRYLPTIHTSSDPDPSRLPTPGPSRLPTLTPCDRRLSQASASDLFGAVDVVVMSECIYN